jgi:predicted  nucleic acid-binding Zn-ribbon protein
MPRKLALSKEDLKKASESHEFCLDSLKKANEEISRLKNESETLKKELDYVEERLRSTIGESKNHPWRG